MWTVIKEERGIKVEIDTEATLSLTLVWMFSTHIFQLNCNAEWDEQEKSFYNIFEYMERDEKESGNAFCWFEERLSIVFGFHVIVLHLNLR